VITLSHEKRTLQKWEEIEKGLNYALIKYAYVENEMY